MSEAPRRGWTAWTEEIPARTMLDMPPDLSKKVVNFLSALALEVGGAIDRDRQPPGDPMEPMGPMDDLCGRYSLQIPGEPVVFEYLVLRRRREIRIPVLVWFR
ncbi:hypothetical protein IGW14_32875 [Streptomyces hygroscopicus subsp. hygroscopicus]|uniref:hypothetical protein n=1 Tax=Streptomyces TaxID=1883 RepID=UPI000767C7E3|nr:MULTISPECIES: hypothetical protein [Streptomyces]MBW8092636.1 hypothetical protein [Streptomyces hygroscopicus subsp. hygroscopicus]MCO8307766.1 hypothetical protein [Streptomyces sp. RKCA744]